MAETTEVVVPVSMTNVSDLMGAELRIQYNTEDLEFIRIQDTQLPGQWVANFSTTRQLLIINWFGPVSNPPVGLSPNGKIFDLVFNYTGDDTTPISFELESCKLINTNLATIPNVTFESGSVSPDIFAGSVSMTEVSALQNSHIIMPVIFKGKGFTAVTNFTLHVEYNTNAFEFIAVEPVQGFSGITATEANGVITITRTGGALNLTASSHVFDIKLLYKGSTAQNLNFRNDSQVSSNQGQLMTRYTNGTIIPVDEGAFLLMDDVDMFVDAIAPSGNTLQVPVYAADFTSSVGSINLLIDYDSEQLIYKGFTPKQLTNWVVTAVDSQIFIEWSDPVGETIMNDELFLLEFTYTEPVNTEISFSELSVFRNVYFASLPVSYDDASIYITDVTYNLTLLVEPEDGGLVTGAGEYAPDEEATINATPSVGYTFVNWTAADGAIFSEVPENTLVMTEDVTLTANFEKIDYTLTLNALPEEGGTVTGDGNYHYDDEVTIQAAAEEGYQFISWTNESGQVFSVTAETTFNMPANDLVLTANFQIIDYTLTLQISPLNAGAVEGSGTYNFNDEVTIEATPAVGYLFVNWTNLQGGEISADPVYSFIMPSENLTMVANFVRVYAVTFNVDMTYVDGYYHKFSFNPDADEVFVTGSMFDWASPGTAPAEDPMVPTTANPMIYTKTVHVEPGEYTYKYFLNTGTTNGEWDEDTTRGFFVINADVVLNDWFGTLTNPTNVIQNEIVDLKVYPNPVRNTLHVESTGQINEVRLVDMLGQLVFVSTVNHDRTQIDVSGLRGSLYFLQVISENGMETHRIQVIK